MKAEIAQMVALACHGNGVLRGMKVPAFFPSNSTCEFCERVTFVESHKATFGGLKEETVAKTPDAWFELLKRQAVLGLRLSVAPQNDEGISDRMAAAFMGGGGIWVLEVLLRKAVSQLWRSQWAAGNEKAVDKKIWRVTYGHVGRGDTPDDAGPNLDQARDALLGALVEIQEFSQSQDCAGFTETFGRAMEALTAAPGAAPGHHRELAPKGVLTPRAEAMLHACQHAWVFGGMGSWNDLGFDGETGKSYNRVSENLFQALNQAIVVAANDSFAAR